jgi:hypothetical protein
MAARKTQTEFARSGAGYALLADVLAHVLVDVAPAYIPTPVTAYKSSFFT